MRPIVLSVMGGHLTSLVDGRLVSLMPDHPDAQLIALAPTLLAQRDALRAALEKLVEMHDESVFICGKDDERMVETLLESARAALAAEKAGA